MKAGIKVTRKTPADQVIQSIIILVANLSSHIHGTSRVELAHKDAYDVVIKQLQSIEVIEDPVF